MGALGQFQPTQITPEMQSQLLNTRGEQMQAAQAQFAALTPEQQAMTPQQRLAAMTPEQQAYFENDALVQRQQMAAMTPEQRAMYYSQQQPAQS